MKNWIKKNKTDLIIYFGFLFILMLLITLAVLPGYKTAINTDTPYNPVALNISALGLEIRWYAIFILSGLIMASVMANAEIQRFGWKQDDLLDGLLIIAPLAILGARTYYIIFNKDASFSEFFRFEGLAIHGSIIVATIGIIIYSKYKKLNVFAIADLLAIGFLMGQIAGRWGNFMNAEAHGSVTTTRFLYKVLPNFIKHQMQFSGTSSVFPRIYQPTFLLESIWNFIGLTILLILRRKRVLKVGDMLGIYLIWYGFGRGILVEPLRTDQLDPVFGVPVNILLSLTLFVGGGIIYLILKRVYNKDEKYYVDLLINDYEFKLRKGKSKEEND